MRSSLLSFLTIGLLAGFVQAQTNCSTLTVQAGTGQSHQTVVFHVQDDPNALVGLVLGFQAGSTTIPLGDLGTLQLGIVAPYDIQFIGTTNGGGNLTYTVQVPATLPLTNLAAQAFTVPDATQRPLPFCTSNVATFQVGS